MNLEVGVLSRVRAYLLALVPVILLLSAFGPTANAATATGLFSAVTPLTEAPAVAGDDLGYGRYSGGVALSADGRTALVAAPGASVYPPSSSTAVIDAGKAYIYHYAKGQWHLAREIDDPNATAYDAFGLSVALSADGTAALIITYNDVTPTNAIGKAYLYKLSNGVWSLAHEFDNPVYTIDNFGTWLAVSAHGHVVVIAADMATVNSQNYAGEVYIYSDTTGTWKQTAAIPDPDTTQNDAFGKPVTIAANGTNVLIGSAAAVNGQTYAGKAYLYTLTNGTWIKTHEFDDPSPTANDYFGDCGASLSADGKSAAFAACMASTHGEIYLFSDSSGSWIQTGVISDPDATSGDNFGYKVQLSANGQHLIAGSLAPASGTYSNSGKAYLYTAANGTWTKTHEFDDPGPVASNDYFGSYGTAISSGGETAFFSAYNKTVNGKSKAGEAYIYQSPDDLGLALSASPTSVSTGNSVTLNATVVNNDSAITANGVAFTATLPSAFSYASSNTAGGTCAASGGTVTCTEASLAPGATWQPSIVATANSTGTFSVSGNVTSGEPDPATSNNAATASINVTASSTGGGSSTSSGGGGGGGALGFGALAALGLLMLAGLKRRN